jgi:hypothetical protein
MTCTDLDQATPDPAPRYRVIKQNLLSELQRRDPAYEERWLLYELVDSLINQAIADDPDALRFFSYM